MEQAWNRHGKVTMEKIRLHSSTPLLFDEEQTRYDEWLDGDGKFHFGQVSRSTGMPEGLVRIVTCNESIVEGVRLGTKWRGFYRIINADGSADVKFYNAQG